MTKIRRKKPLGFPLNSESTLYFKIIHPFFFCNSRNKGLRIISTMTGYEFTRNKNRVRTKVAKLFIIIRLLIST